MITREQANLLANLVRTFRPEWDAMLTADQLRRVDAALPVVSAHALAVAGDRSNRTPLTLSWEPAASTVAAAGGELPRGDKRSCQHCNRSERGCENAQRNTGLDYHDYQP